MDQQPTRDCLRYRPTPTAEPFHLDRSEIRAIMGPIGSGKSVTCCMELFFLACAQRPDRYGIRRTRWAVIRNTYPELRSTTIKTWQQWFPESICPVNWGAPITANLGAVLADGTKVKAEILFLSLDRPADVKKVLSLEITGAWINEAREIPRTVFDAVYSRCGRYPSKAAGVGITWSGVILDSNPPDTDHWWYKLFELEKPPGYVLYRQPPAVRLVDGIWELNPDAENVENQQLGGLYWTRQAVGKDPQWIKVYLQGDYGTAFDGRPVYESLWSSALHLAPAPIEPWRGIPLVLGWDFGLTPACVGVQVLPDGRFRVLREWVCPDGALRQFAQDVVRPALAGEFGGMVVRSWCDPAGAQRSQVDGSTCLSELARVGIQTTPAPTNEFLPRRQAVVNYLTRSIATEPAFRLDPRCELLRKGFDGGYQFRRVQVAGEDRFKDVPDKNAYSHPHDALQYAALGASPEYQAPVAGGRNPGVYRPDISTWGV